MNIESIAKQWLNDQNLFIPKYYAMCETEYDYAWEDRETIESLVKLLARVRTELG